MGEQKPEEKMPRISPDLVAYLDKGIPAPRAELKLLASEQARMDLAHEVGRRAVVEHLIVMLKKQQGQDQKGK